MKAKVNDLVRLHKAIQEKLSKFLPCYLINGLECTAPNISMSFNTLFELHMKSKKYVEYYQKLLLKKKKLSRLNYFIWKLTFMKMKISVGRCLKSKNMFV